MKGMGSKKQEVRKAVKARKKAKRVIEPTKPELTLVPHDYQVPVPDYECGCGCEYEHDAITLDDSELAMHGLRVDRAAGAPGAGYMVGATGACGPGSVPFITKRDLEAGELVTTNDVAPLPRIHVIGLHHTVPDETFSHCAFTGKVLRFPLVLHAAGYHVIEYSNGVSHSEADDHVQIFTRPQLQEMFGGEESLLADCTLTNAHDVDVQTAYYSLVLRELRKRARPGDVIAHVAGWGPTNHFVRELLECVHVETGIGYSAAPFGAYRIFESESWRAWHMGKYMAPNNGAALTDTFPHYSEFCCTAVVPNYYDESQWPVGASTGCNPQGVPVPDGDPYVFFAGRMTSGKGIEVVQWLAEQFPDLTFCVASGEPRSERLSAPNIRWVGRVEKRSELAAWYGGALATLVPSRFHEPFGGVAVESLMCGTPVIASDWAAFTETVQEGDGLRCNDYYEFKVALQHVLDERSAWQSESEREARRERAQARFGIAAVGLRYNAALDMFRRMHGEGMRP